MKSSLPNKNLIMFGVLFSILAVLVVFVLYSFQSDSFDKKVLCAKYIEAANEYAHENLTNQTDEPFQIDEIFYSHKASSCIALHRNISRTYDSVTYSIFDVLANKIIFSEACRSTNKDLCEYTRSNWEEVAESYR